MTLKISLFLLPLLLCVYAEEGRILKAVVLEAEFLPKQDSLPFDMTQDEFEAATRQGNCDYGTNFGPTHVMMLPPNPTCPSLIRSGVNNNERGNIVRFHNQYRTRVARGNERRGFGGEGQPPATSIPGLRWNAELATIAQAWANQCVFAHDDNEVRRICSRDYSVGQNAYMGTGNWRAAIDMWYSEVDNYPGDWVDEFTGLVGPNGQRIGHYTQMVWGNTQEIGCGAIHFRYNYLGYVYNMKHYFCNYGPAGNVMGEPVYARRT